MSYVTRQHVQESAFQVATMIRKLKNQALEQSDTYKQAIAELQECKRRTEHNHDFPDFVSVFVINEAIRQIEEEALRARINKIHPVQLGGARVSDSILRNIQKDTEGMK